MGAALRAFARLGQLIFRVPILLCGKIEARRLAAQRAANVQWGGVLLYDRKRKTSASSMAAGSLLERGLLLGARLLLVLGLPGLVRHAVDEFAALVLAQRHALLVGRVLHPVGEAVAAEAGEIHQVEVLHVG